MQAQLIDRRVHVRASLVSTCAMQCDRCGSMVSKTCVPMLVHAGQEYKQASKGMSTELTKSLTRHVRRMIALAPDNPAGYEMMSYVLMKNTSTLREAAS